jgi:hypothetical protein
MPLITNLYIILPHDVFRTLKSRISTTTAIASQKQPYVRTFPRLLIPTSPIPQSGKSGCDIHPISLPQNTYLRSNGLKGKCCGAYLSAASLTAGYVRIQYRTYNSLHHGFKSSVAQRELAGCDLSACTHIFGLACNALEIADGDTIYI